jgi:hypothetical protein
VPLRELAAARRGVLDERRQILWNHGRLGSAAAARKPLTRPPTRRWTAMPSPRAIRADDGQAPRGAGFDTRGASHLRVDDQAPQRPRQVRASATEAHRSWCKRNDVELGRASKDSFCGSSAAERFFRTLETEWPRRIQAPIRRDDFRLAMSRHIDGHHEHRPRWE